MPDPIEAEIIPGPVIEHASERKPWLWKPGQTGNPNGRPKKGDAMVDLLRDKIEEVHPAEAALATKQGRPARTNREAIIDALLRRALTGDLAAATFIFNRLSPPTRKVAVEGRVEHEHQHSASRDAVIARIEDLRKRSLTP